MRHTNLYSRQLPDCLVNKIALSHSAAYKQQHEINILQYLRQTHQLNVDGLLKFHFTNNSRRQKRFKLQHGYHATTNSIKHIKFYQFMPIVLKLRNPTFMNVN